MTVAQALKEKSKANRDYFTDSADLDEFAHVLVGITEEETRAMIPFTC